MEEESRSIINRSKYSYPAVRVRGPDGRMRASRSNGDAVARAMLGMTNDQVAELIGVNGLHDKLSRHLGARNPGQVRMLTGNALRHLVKQGTPVAIGEHTIKKLDQKTPVVKKPGSSTPRRRAAKGNPKEAKEKASKRGTGGPS